MRKALTVFFVCGGVALTLLVGAATRSEVKNQHRCRSVEVSLARSLAPGASADQIEQNLAAAGLGFTFDKLLSRYEASVRTSDFWRCGVGVIVEVDADRRMKKLAVQAYYTGL